MAGLVAGALLCFVIAAVVWSRARQFEATAVSAAGVVTRLNAGPHHADVAVVAVDGTAFTFAANTREALSPGQRVQVRYLPAAPAASARLKGQGGELAGWEFVAMGALMIAAALFIPALLRWFPGLLASPIRP